MQALDGSPNPKPWETKKIQNSTSLLSNQEFNPVHAIFLVPLYHFPQLNGLTLVSHIQSQPSQCAHLSHVHSKQRTTISFEIRSRHLGNPAPKSQHHLLAYPIWTPKPPNQNPVTTTSKKLKPFQRNILPSTRNEIGQQQPQHNINLTSSHSRTSQRKSSNALQNFQSIPEKGVEKDDRAMKPHSSANPTTSNPDAVPSTMPTKPKRNCAITRERLWPARRETAWRELCWLDHQAL